MLSLKKNDRLVRFSKRDGMPHELKVKKVEKEIVSIEHPEKAYLVSGIERYIVVTKDGKRYRLDGSDGQIFKMVDEHSFIKIEE